MSMVEILPHTCFFYGSHTLTAWLDHEEDDI